jgi:hypothetical protein
MKNNFWRLAILFTSCLAPTFTIWAQSARRLPVEVDSQEFRQEGKLISIQIVAKPQLKLFVTGREALEVNFRDFSVRVKRLSPLPLKDISLVPRGDHFEFSQPTELRGPVELEIETKFKNQQETLKLKMDHKQQSIP